jgi:hypothetical protein
MRSALARWLLLAAATAALAPSPALADGDPASDVLLGENVFYPYSPVVSPSLQKALNAETAAAGRAHFPLKVALIASPSDLGAIPTLYGKPQQYAAFLDQEISFVDMKQLVLVVMPDGYGVHSLGPAATRAAAALPKPVGGQRDRLAQAALAAVPRLAAAAGHPIARVSPVSPSSGPSAVLAVVLLAVVAVMSALGVHWIRSRRQRPRPGG